MPGIMDHAKNANFVLDLDVEDAVREVSERSPSNGAMNCRMEERVFRDANEHSLKISEEPLSQAGLASFVPARCLVEVALDKGPEAGAHARLRGRAFLSSQVTLVCGCAPA